MLKQHAKYVVFAKKKIAQPTTRRDKKWHGLDKETQIFDVMEFLFGQFLLSTHGYQTGPTLLRARTLACAQNCVTPGVEHINSQT